MPTYGFPSGSNTYLPSHQASGSLVLGYSRNINKFAVNRYLQRIPVAKDLFYVLNWNSEEAQRIRTTNGSEFLWRSGQDAPTGVGNTESFNYQPFSTQRYAYPYVLDWKAVQQADWNVLAAHGAVAAGKAMTHRTLATINALSAAGFTTATATALGGGKFNVGTPSNPYMKIGLFTAATSVNIATAGNVGVEDLALLMNPNTAFKIGSSQEITDNLKYSSGLTYILDGNPVTVDPNWGLPSRLYGFETIVDQTTILTTAKGNATQTGVYIIPDGTIYVISKAGGLEGLEGSQSWSTVQGFFKEEFTVESMEDVGNRVTKARVVSDFSVQVTTQGIKSGYAITACI